MKRLVLLALAIATLIKLYLALFTQGSFDVLIYKGHLELVQQLGVTAYRSDGTFHNPFIHPPPVIHLLKFWGWLSKSGIPFGFWLRLPSVLADIGSFFLVWRWLRTFNLDNIYVLLALALCPTSILISGFHGNTDSLMMFLFLLSLFLIEKRSRWAGLVFGLALGIKIVPIIYAPAIFFSQHWRRRVEFFGLACITFLTCSLPYILQDPYLVITSVFGYASVYGGWGWSLLAYLFIPEPPTYLIHYGAMKYGVQGTHAIVAQVLKVITISIAVVLPLWRRNEPLVLKCAFITAIVLFFAPGFGYQYLVWLVPFAPLFGWPLMLAYYCATGFYLSTVYICYAERFCPTPIYVPLMSLACWLVILMMLMRTIRLMFTPAIHTAIETL